MTNIYDRLYYSIDNYDVLDELEKETQQKRMNDNHQSILSLLQPFKKPITIITSDSIKIEYFSNIAIITLTITSKDTYDWETISYITDSTFRGTQSYTTLDPTIEPILYHYFYFKK